MTGHQASLATKLARASMTRGTKFIHATLVALCLLLFIAQVQWHPAPLTVRLEILTTEPIRLGVLYNFGGGTPSEGHISRNLNGAPTFQTVRFPIDKKELGDFRLQQIHRASAYMIRNVAIERLGGKIVKVPPGRLKPHAGISALVRNGETVAIQPAPDAGLTDLAVRVRKPVHQTSFVPRLDLTLTILLGVACVALVWTTVRDQSTQPNPPLNFGRLATRGRIVALLTALYLAASIGGLSGSSSALWRLMADHENPDAGAIVGNPKFIRSDEWLVHTPWILSQCNQQPSFPVVNHSVGEGPAPLITSLPVRHWSMFFRPQYLGFFFLPRDQAFAFYWNFKWFALLLGAFLFLELIVGGRSLIALSGSAFVLFSGFVQWWFSSPTMMPEMIGMFFLILWASAMIFRSASKWAAIGAATILLCAIEQFVFCCYPRFQIPLFYLALFILLGTAWRFPLTRHRVLLFAGTLIAAGLVLVPWQREISPLLAGIRTLVYPGQVFYTGGNFLWRWFAAPFFEFAMTEENFPFTTGNSCEAAGYLFLLPLLAALLLRDAVRRKFDPLLIAPTVLALLLVFYMCVGVPPSFARWSGLSLVATTRANIALGIASAIALFRYLGRNDSEAPAISVRPQLILFAVLSLLLGGIFYQANLQLAHYVGLHTVAVVSLYFALISVVLWNRLAATACTLLLVPLICAYGLVNPINRGLPAFRESPLWQTMRELQQGDPNAQWLVLGPPGWSNFIAQFAKSAGAHVLGGVRCNPDPKMIGLLDPTDSYHQVHSRYAHISFVPTTSSTPTFELTATDTYSIRLPTNTDLISRLGVTYLVDFDSTKPAMRIAGFEEIRSVDGIRFLRATRSPP